MRQEIKELLTKQVVNSKEAAKMIGMSQALIKQYAMKGKLECVVISQVALFDIEDIERLKSNWTS